MVLGLDVDLLVTVRVCIFRRRWPPLCGSCELRSFLASSLFLTMEHQPLLPAPGSLPLPMAAARRVPGSRPLSILQLGACCARRAPFSSPASRALPGSCAQHRRL
jgi:hypothetical protein